MRRERALIKRTVNWSEESRACVRFKTTDQKPRRLLHMIAITPACLKLIPWRSARSKQLMRMPSAKVRGAVLAGSPSLPTNDPYLRRRCDKSYGNNSFLGADSYENRSKRATTLSIRPSSCQIQKSKSIALNVEDRARIYTAMVYRLILAPV